jgi:enamine deaminase RidA (YjgF/YER057c/UK114 family)
VSRDQRRPEAEPPGLRMVNPEQLADPRGYSHGVVAPAGGRLLTVAGQVGWNATGELVDGGFVAQFEQALRNVVTVLREAGGTPRDLVRLTIWVTDRRSYLAATPEVGAAYRRVVGRHYPAMALLEVQGLLEPGAEVEIEATAVLGPSGKDR